MSSSTSKSESNTSDEGNKSSNLQSLIETITNFSRVGQRPKTIQVSQDIFKDPNIKQDLVRMIIQYLQDEGYTNAQMVLQDEANIKMHEQKIDQAHVKRMRKAILDGDWPEVEKLCTSRPIFNSQSTFLHAVYKQQFLEMVEKSENQNAFSFLTKRLKPLEHVAPEEFKDMCYVLTARSVQDAPSFANWEGSAARRKLVNHFQSLLDYETTANSSIPVAPNRLLELLRQSVSYQLEFSRYHPKVIPKIDTLLYDYTSFVIPNACRSTLRGHTGSVKAIDYCGEEGLRIVSGSSDTTVRVWSTETSECLGVLEGHTARVWDVNTSRDSNTVVSASADGTVRVWNIEAENLSSIQQQSEHLQQTPISITNTTTIRDSKKSSNYSKDQNKSLLSRAVLNATGGDLYTVKMHPGGTHLATGGYDKQVHLFDIRNGQNVKTFSGHELSVSSVSFNTHGNLVVSGSKDKTVRFWDIASGLCVNTISATMGEVTSLEFNSSGSQLLIAWKDNSNRLYDLRMMKPMKRYRGHQNTSKNFIRAGFGPTQSLITSGSEDGVIHIWDLQTGNVLQRLEGHTGIVYSAKWSSRQSLITSCSDDFTLKTWWFDESKPLFTSN